MTRPLEFPSGGRDAAPSASALAIQKGLPLSAQGSEEGATPGRCPQGSSTPKGLRQFLIFILVLFLAHTASAQTPETRAYDAAVRAFQDRALELADKYFRDFLQAYPSSPRVPEAILYRARAALLRRDIEAATGLLTTNAARATQLQDQYRYWLAETHREATNYAAAADTFASLVQDFPASPRVLEASYGEAVARFKLQQWSRVIDLLRATNAPFAKEAEARPNHELVLRGQLLLADALLENGDPSAAEAALRSLAQRELAAEFRWRSEYLLCRIRLVQGRAADALAISTNLVALAAATGQRQFIAESHAVNGAVLERIADYDAAVAAYQRNITETSPPEYRRQALLRIIQLTLEQNKLNEATEKLESFFTQYRDDAASEVALLTLGELNLRRHLAGLSNRTNAAPLATNFLQVALTHFDRLATNNPAGHFIGEAHLNRGWCFWFDGKMPEAQQAFHLATSKLPHSESEAVAQFKLADVQFQLRDYTNALAGYRAVINDYKSLPRVQDELISHALYQLLRVNLELKDLPAASAAVQELLRSHSESPFTDRTLLLLGQDLAKNSRATDARTLFAQFVKLYPESPLRAEVELAIARSYLHERQWEPALQHYEAWLNRFGSTNQLRSRAEFSYADANYQAGRLTNALPLFTNFLARFPNDPNAPAARYSVGALYYAQKDYVNAESTFQRLFQDWSGHKLAYEARIMAARSAAARQAYKAAYDYSVALGTDTNAPPQLAVDAFFIAGDSIIQQPGDPAKPLENFELAITAFNKIIQLYPTNSSAPLAWGRIGDCHFQLASRDPKLYESATNAYFKVLTSPMAGISARSQARVGIGIVLERLARTTDPELWRAAFESYYSVADPRHLRDGEKLDPYWFYNAGLAAARLAEEHQEWETAIRIYLRMIDALPALRPGLERKLEKAREQLSPSSQ
jgi:TolA-binding protein